MLRKEANPTERMSMRSTPTKLAAVLAGSVALASAAYGVGTQVDDGSATAASGASADGRADRGERFGGLARRLGVSEAKLRAALTDLRGDLAERRRADFAAELAKELDKETSEVRAALRRIRAAHEKEHAARRDEFAKKLADKLGISEAKVKAALPQGGPGRHRRGGPGGPHGGPRGFGGPPPRGPGF